MSIIAVIYFRRGWDVGHTINSVQIRSSAQSRNESLKSFFSRTAATLFVSFHVMAHNYTQLFRITSLAATVPGRFKFLMSYHRICFFRRCRFGSPPEAEHKMYPGSAFSALTGCRILLIAWVRSGCGRQVFAGWLKITGMINECYLIDVDALLDAKNRLRKFVLLLPVNVSFIF